MKSITKNEFTELITRNKIIFMGVSKTLFEKEYRITADSVLDALGKFAQLVNDNQCITISKNAIKNRQPMYLDTPNGVKQVGYVLTALTDFQDNNHHLVKQYIDLWVDVVTVCDTEFI